MAKPNLLSKICVPAQVYLILSVLLLLVGAYYNFSVLTLVVKVVFVGIWTWLLNLLCKSDYMVLSWILALLPFVMLFLSALIAIDVVSHIMVKTAIANTSGVTPIHSIVLAGH